MTRKAVCSPVLLSAVVALFIGLSVRADDQFVPIFDGKTLEGWDGNPDLWSVKDGVIHGETTPEKPTKINTFLISEAAGQLKDFELKLKFQIENGNSGVQYRSKEFDKFRITGYQAEVENNQGKVGFLYHEGGRGWLRKPTRNPHCRTSSTSRSAK